MGTLLDPRDPTPLWAQLTTELRRRLGSGQYVGRFPTEAELTSEFVVSRATVREALRRLKDDGLLDARRGSGTFVVRRELDQPVIGASGLAREIADAGLEESSKLLRLEEGEAGAAVAAALGITAEAPVVWLERLRGAGDRVLALDRSAVALDAEGRRALLSVDLATGSLYDALAERCDIQVTGATEQVRASAGSASDRRRMRLAAEEGLLEVERVSFAGPVAVEWRRSLLRGSAYVLGSSWGSVPR